MKAPRKNAWTAEQIALLGTDSDAVIAKQLGKSTNTVAQRRIGYGIAPKYPQKSEKNTFDSADNCALLGKFTDKFVAEKLGISVASVTRSRHRRGIKAVTQNTGFDPLKELSQVEFYKALAAMSSEPLTYKRLADVCYVSHSRIQKWFASGTGQERLSLQMRQHLYLAVLFYLV